MGKLDASIAETQKKVENTPTETVSQLKEHLGKTNLTDLGEHVGQLDTSVAKISEQATARHQEQAATAQASQEKIALCMKLMGESTTLIRTVSLRCCFFSYR